VIYRDYKSQDPGFRIANPKERRRKRRKRRGITNPKTPAFGLQIRKSEEEREKREEGLQIRKSEEEEREEGLQIPSLLLSDCKSEKAKFIIQKKQEESRKGSQNKAVEKGAILLLLFLF